MRYLKITLAILIALSVPASADYAFSQNNFGVRGLGLGGAGAAFLNDSEQIFYNPAVPPIHSAPSFKFEMGQRLATPFVAATAQGLPGPFLWSAMTAWDNGIPGTALNEYGQPVATGTSFGWQLLDVRTALPVSFLGARWALTGHAVQESLGGKRGIGVSLSGSAYYDFVLAQYPIQLSAQLNDGLSTGMRWNTGAVDGIPIDGRAGVALSSPSRKWTAAAEGIIRYRRDPYTGRSARSYGVNLGAEYWVLGNPLTELALAMRAGLREGDITAGFGSYLNGCLIDFAYIQPSDPAFETEYRLSVGWTFAPLQAAPPAEFFARPAKATLANFQLPGTPILSAILQVQPELQIQFQEGSRNIPVLIDGNQWIAQPNQTHPLSTLPKLIIVPITAETAVTLKLDYSDAGLLLVSGNAPPTTIIHLNGFQIEPATDSSLSAILPVSEPISEITLNIRSI